MTSADLSHSSPSAGHSRNWRALAIEYSPWILALILIAVGTAATPLFLTVDNFSNILQQSSIIGILAIGQFLVILTGGIDLSVGSLLAFSAMVGALSMAYGDVAGVAISLLACALLGGLSGALVTFGGLPPFIVTFGMMAIARGLALTLTSGTPVNLEPSILSNIGGGYWPETIWGVVILAAYVLLRRFPIGRHIYAVGGNREGARISGINTDMLIILVYTLSGICAAIGGLIFMERSTVALPTSGIGYELQTIAAAVLGGANLFGGAGRLSGVVLGVIILTLLSNIFDLTGVNPFWNFIAIGITLWFAVVLRTRLMSAR